MVLKDIGLILKKDGKPGRIYDISQQIYYDDIVDMLERFIEESKKQDLFIAWDGLKYQKLSILNVLHRLGYTWTKCNKKDMHVGDMRGRLASNRVFYIQIKTAGHSYITLQAIDQIIGQKKPAQSEEELRGFLALYHYVKGRITDKEGRILYSASSISRTLFNRASSTYKMSASYYKEYENDLYYKKADGTEKRYSANLFLEHYFRPAVHGGFNAMSGRALGYDGPAVVLDVNSLYPYIACTAVLPTLGIVEAGDGNPDVDYIRHKDSYYTFMKVEVTADIKENGVPSIITDGSAFFNTEARTHMKRRVLTLSEADRKLLYENYNIRYFRIKSYVVFRAVDRDFEDYFMPMYEAKKKAHGVERDYYKLMMNGLIGNFAKNVYVDDYVVEEDEQGIYNIVKHQKDEWQMLDELGKTQGLLYINVAIVSEARRYIVGYIRKHLDRWLYTDTDSIHLRGTEIPEDIPVSDELGDFKPEHIYTRVKYYGIKRYIGYTDDGKLLPTISGLPKDVFEPVHKMPGVDAVYFNKAIKHHKIEQLFKKPISIYNVVEDLESLTVSVEWVKGWVMDEQPTKAEYHAIEKNREEAYEQWYEDHHKLLKEMLDASHRKWYDHDRWVRIYTQEVMSRGWDAIAPQYVDEFKEEVAERLADRGVFFV